MTSPSGVHNNVKRYAVRKWKEQQGCTNCGERRADALEVHHPDDRNPKLAYSGPPGGRYARGFQALSWAEIEVEVPKCLVLCANCHRCETAEELRVMDEEEVLIHLKDPLTRYVPARVAAFAALGVDHPSRPPCIRGHGPEWRYENAAGESVCRRCERERSRNYYQRHRGKEVD